MPLAFPWDLVTAEPVPDSVLWLALFDRPAVPITLDTVNAVRSADLGVQVEYGPPEISEPNRLAWRSFVALVTGPDNGGQYPYTVAALAMIETDGGQLLLGVFTPDQPGMIGQAGGALEIQGFLQVTKYQ
jgi:hypothetical protein